MTGRERLVAALERLALDEDELRDLDALIGDGDLGFTVAEGSRAVVAVLRAAPADASPDALLVEAAKAFGRANPSTFAALTQSALLRGGKAYAAAAGEGAPPDGAALVALLVASAVDAVGQRGKAEVGDKTVLDPLAATAPVAAAADRLDAHLFAAMAAAADSATAALTDRQSQRGRAAWLQERSKGLVDPGSVAYTRFLEYLAQAWEER